MFDVLSGTDTQYLINMLEEMFGEGPVVDPKELLTSDVKAKFKKARQAKVSTAKEVGELDPEYEIKIIKATSLPIGADFGIYPDFYPESITVPGVSAKTGKPIDKFYYHCKVCRSHQSQNHPSMCTHTQKCLNIKIACPACKATYDSLDYLQNHIIKNHGGKMEVQHALEAIVTKLAESTRLGIAPIIPNVSVYIFLCIIVYYVYLFVSIS